jgi:hypothetical protein
MVREVMWTPTQAARYFLADQLRAEFNDTMPLMEPSVYTDLLRAALDRVSWAELAEDLLAELHD